MFFLIIGSIDVARVPGLPATGANASVLPFTAPADAGVARFGYPLAICSFPMDPHGHPMLALITRAAVRCADQIIILKFIIILNNELISILGVNIYFAPLDFSNSPRKGLCGFETGYVKKGMGGGSVLYASWFGVGVPETTARTNELYRKISAPKPAK
jgi:NaMN:DMB phosphoribosyltransferase